MSLLLLPAGSVTDDLEGTRVAILPHGAPGPANEGTLVKAVHKDRTGRLPDRTLLTLRADDGTVTVTVVTSDYPVWISP